MLALPRTLEDAGHERLAGTGPGVGRKFLAIGGPVSTNELAVGLVMDRTTLTRNLRLLRDAGLVETHPGRSGREVRFTLSDEGRDTLARAIPVWREAQSSIVTAFGEARWPTMVAELHRLVSGTMALSDEAGRFDHTAVQNM